MTENQKQKISWDEFERDSRQLARLIAGAMNVEGIVCVARGGLVATAVVANALNIRNVKSVAVVSYHGYQQMTAELLGSVDAIGDGSGWVFIDDLVDTGQTAKLLRKRYPKAKIACVYAKPAGRDTIDFSTREFAQDLWLEFPWE